MNLSLNKKTLGVKITSSITLKKRLERVYNMHGDLSTVCLRQCNCCRVSCPQMNYAEAILIIDYIWKKWNDEQKIKLIITAIKYFFSRELNKPCPLLSGNNCLIYDIRPLSCRLYGLWPSDVYEKRVQLVSEAIKLPKEKIPLNVQCKMVRRKNGEVLSNEQIEQMYAALDKIDFHLLLNGDLTKKEEIAHKIQKKWHYRTLHDWLLFLFFGEEWLAKLTTFALAASKDVLNDFISILENDTIPKLLIKKIKK